MHSALTFAAGAYCAQAVHSYVNWKGIGAGRFGAPKRVSLKRAIAAAIWPFTITFFALVSRIAGPQ